MTQTAVEWLIEIQKSQSGLLFESDIEKAKEMEKQQIIDAFNEGQALNVRGRLIQGKEWYLNETFNK